MQEILTQIFGYVWGAWKYRWHALIVAWLMCAAGWAWVWQLPEAYVGSARIYVDSSSVLRPLLHGLAIQPDIDQRVSMMSRTLLSRPNLEKLMRMTDLDLQVTDDAQQEKMVEELQQTVSLAGDPDNVSLYSIRVKHEDRDMAKRITQALITVFIESSLSEKREDSTIAQDFLDEQIAEYEVRLMASESRLAQFKQQNVDMLPGSGGDYYSRLQSAREDLNTAKLALREMENRRSELERQVAGEEPVFFSGSLSSTESMTPLDVRVQTLKTQLDSLLTRYTDKHPEVRQLRNMIDDLEAEKMAQYGRIRDDSPGGIAPLGGSPVYMNIRSMLAQTEADVAELTIRTTEYQRRVDELEARVNTIPEIEAQLTQLNRDYEVVSKQHQEMLQRRESARLSEDVEQSASDVAFRVIEPPFVPGKPGEPNKLLLNAIVLVFALGFGAGIALLISLINPVISNTRTLAYISGFPTLGVVPLSQPPEVKRREMYGRLAFTSLTVGLVVVFLGLNFVPSLVMA